MIRNGDLSTPFRRPQSHIQLSNIQAQGGHVTERKTGGVLSFTFQYHNFVMDNEKRFPDVVL